MSEKDNLQEADGKKLELKIEATDSNLQETSVPEKIATSLNENTEVVTTSEEDNADQILSSDENSALLDESIEEIESSNAEDAEERWCKNSQQFVDIFCEWPRRGRLTLISALNR